MAAQPRGKKQSEQAKKPEQAERLIPIFIMGQKYLVPDSLTIQKAMEYAGFQLVRGCGCRGGICGACGTVFRYPDSHRIDVGLACQTVVQPSMYLAQIPFFPANKSVYDVEKLSSSGDDVARLYPEIFKCIGCNVCTKSCPMDIDVMEYVARAIRGDVAGVAELSFDCVMCGLCAARCPAEEAQYNFAILCRRLYGRYIAPRAQHLSQRIREIERKKFHRPVQSLMQADKDKLMTLYKNREIEPDMAEEDWTPEDARYV
jgi:formate hydrogenlyase subunit 6/NADH:ubiquinone oxidoreductase subunit I